MTISRAVAVVAVVASLLGCSTPAAMNQPIDSLDPGSIAGRRHLASPERSSRILLGG
jgi:hypothetical protein